MFLRTRYIINSNFNLTAHLDKLKYFYILSKFTYLPNDRNDHCLAYTKSL